MEEKPISFNVPMVRAILEGRKTQTRRIIKPQPDSIHDGEPYWNIGGYRAYQKRWINDPLRMGTLNPILCPYGENMDRIWVRETWAQDLHGELFWRADHINKPSTVEKWRQSRFMPRSASRITLEIIHIRVERLQDMSEENAKAEGVYEFSPGHGTWWAKDPKDGQGNGPWAFAKGANSELWDSIYAKRGFGWDKNPWVWVIEFKRIEGVR